MEKGESCGQLRVVVQMRRYEMAQVLRIARTKESGLIEAGVDCDRKHWRESRNAKMAWTDSDSGLSMP